MEPTNDLDTVWIELRVVPPPHLMIHEPGEAAGQKPPHGLLKERDVVETRDKTMQEEGGLRSDRGLVCVLMNRLRDENHALLLAVHALFQRIFKLPPAPSLMAL
jgi:hypothetical protein